MGHRSFRFQEALVRPSQLLRYLPQLRRSVVLVYFDSAVSKVCWLRQLDRVFRYTIDCHWLSVNDSKRITLPVLQRIGLASSPGG